MRFVFHSEVARMLCHSDVGRVFCGIHGCANVVPRRRLLPLRLRCHCEERMTRIIRTARQRRRRTGRRCSVEASDPVREERRSSSMTREKDLATRIAICTCRRLAGSSGMCAGLGLVTPLGYTSEFPRFSSPLPRFSSLPPILSAFSPFRRFFDIDHPLSPFAFAFRHPFPPPSPLTSLSIFSASAPRVLPAASSFSRAAYPTTIGLAPEISFFGNLPLSTGFQLSYNLPSYALRGLVPFLDLLEILPAAALGWVSGRFGILCQYFTGAPPRLALALPRLSGLSSSITDTVPFVHVTCLHSLPLLQLNVFPSSSPSFHRFLNSSVVHPLGLKVSISTPVPSLSSLFSSLFLSRSTVASLGLFVSGFSLSRILQFNVFSHSAGDFSLTCLMTRASESTPLRLVLITCTLYVSMVSTAHFLPVLSPPHTSLGIFASSYHPTVLLYTVTLHI
ncbi:hypothetical protein MSAN_02500100 [Mycena sanguinolenta]|uniref:Uncharacterized protein n=1 Tax=Mycena sanguinolenta TaxID=230812 RepID=A0A8H6U0N4_9AGAR|nr:hypothetical protein MSAN_02500100 [Mycena sanguinolenta]